jgi:hypothetical protein
LILTTDKWLKEQGDVADSPDLPVDVDEKEHKKRKDSEQKEDKKRKDSEQKEEESKTPLIRL